MERALIQQARPVQLNGRARAVFATEAAKGCLPHIAPRPVALEPPYRRLDAQAIAPDPHEPAWVGCEPVSPEQWVRLEIWVSPKQEHRWRRSEMFLRQLHAIQHRLGFEAVGNQQLGLSLRLLVHHDDLLTVRTVFAGVFDHCTLSRIEHDPWREVCEGARARLCFYDYYPPPPYSHLVTRPDELPVSPFNTLLPAIAELPDALIGLYQVLLQPVAPQHDWHRNVEVLLDLEYMIRGHQSGGERPRYPQQNPSGDLREMAGDVATKAHDDKLFFAAALRLAVAGRGADPNDRLGALDAFSGAIQHQGRRLRKLSENDYQALSPEQRATMLRYGRVYRPGFLVNTAELTTLVHLPMVSLDEPRRIPLEPLEQLPAPSHLAGPGNYIGDCRWAGRSQRVCIPASLPNRHIHLVGAPGQGKSTLMEHLVCDDIIGGDGAAVIDPHGDLVRSVLARLPESERDRVIYLDWSDPQWVPIWNPLKESTPAGRGRLADDIVGAFRSFVDGWGERLAHQLYYALLGLLHLPDPCMLDVAHALRPKSERGKQIRQQVLEVVQGDRLRAFWQEDLLKYASSELAAPQHKLSKLVAEGPLAAMLCQGRTSFSLREAMAEGKVLLVNLAGFGVETRAVVGSLLLALLHSTALGRSQQPADQRRPFRIHVDEAHQFATDALENTFAETRKYGVSLTLAHQYLNQFSRAALDALATVSTTIIFGVNTDDARRLCAGLRQQVEIEDILRLDRGEAIARIGRDIVRIRTRPPAPPAPSIERDPADRIIEHSRQRYYMHLSMQADEGTHPGRAAQAPVVPPEIEQLPYDEFD